MEDNSSTLNFQGAPIIKNNTVSGKANNVSLPSGKTLNISGAMFLGASIGVTTENANYPVIFSNVYSMDYSDYFFSDAGKAINYNSNKQLEIGKDAAHTHSGGTAYCNQKAVCATCGKEYGNVDPDNHSGSKLDEWQKSDEEHWQMYSCCNTIINKAAHHGGMADCMHKAVCAICGGEYGDLASHNFSAETVDVKYIKSAANCENAAVYYKSCTVCGEKGTETFEHGEKDPNNHTGVLSDWQHNDDSHWKVYSCCQSEAERAAHRGGTASCVSKAICEDCGTEYGNLLPHSFTAEKIEEQYLKSVATCTTRAVYYKSCTICGEKGTDTFECGETNPDNHAGTLGGWQHNDDQHWKEYSCCCAKDDIGIHDWDGGKVTESATCTTDGTKTYTCTVCDKKKTEQISATGHNPAEEWTSDATHHWHECANGCNEKVDYAEHTGGTATCTKKAVCADCGREYGEMKAHNFTAETAEEQYLKSAATCTEKAVYFKSCTACGLSSKGTTDEATFTSGDILGHDWDAWTSNSNGTHPYLQARRKPHGNRQLHWRHSDLHGEGCL